VSFERIGAGLFRTCIVVCETVGGATLGGATLLKDADKINRVTISRESSFQRLYIFHDNTFFLEAKNPPLPLFFVYTSEVRMEKPAKN
jgi:hypothetical protein